MDEDSYATGGIPNFNQKETALRQLPKKPNISRIRNVKEFLLRNSRALLLKIQSYYLSADTILFEKIPSMYDLFCRGSATVPEKSRVSGLELHN